MADPRALNRKQLREWAQHKSGGHQFAALAVLDLLDEVEGKETPITNVVSLSSLFELIRSIEQKVSRILDALAHSGVIEKVTSDLAASQQRLSETISTIESGDSGKQIQHTTAGDFNMDPMQQLAEQAQKNTDAEASAVDLLNNLSSMLAAAKNDPAKVQAISDQLKASADKLGAAIVANTPVAPTPTSKS